MTGDPVTFGHRDRARLIPCLVLVVLVLAGCGPATHTRSANTRRSAPPSSEVSAPPAGSCHARTENGQPLPDPACTPGATNPQAPQANLNDTVCKPGWTKTIRPPASYTGALKRAQITAYGYPDTNPAAYEEDHLISLELGGAPTDAHNLWPEPGASPNAKDPVENQLNTAVCGQLVSLAAAQHAIATDWTTALTTLGLQTRGNQVCLTSDPTRCATSRHSEGG
jgi:hypothetical protein